MRAKTPCLVGGRGGRTTGDSGTGLQRMRIRFCIHPHHPCHRSTATRLAAALRCRCEEGSRKQEPHLLLSGSCGISGLAVCLLPSSSHCPRRDTMAVSDVEEPPCSEELGISAFLHCRASTERVNTQH